MAGSKSNYLETALLNHVAKLATFTAPATWYLGLFTSACTDAGVGTECTGGNYARVAITVNGTNLGVTGNVLSNLTDILFLVQTAAIGTPVSWGLLDASSGGNLLFWGDLAGADQKSYLVNDQPIVPAGALTITED